MVKEEEEEERKEKVGEEIRRNPEQPQTESPAYGFSHTDKSEVNCRSSISPLAACQ